MASGDIAGGNGYNSGGSGHTRQCSWIQDEMGALLVIDLVGCGWQVVMLRVGMDMIWVGTDMIQVGMGALVSVARYNVGWGAYHLDLVVVGV